MRRLLFILPLLLSGCCEPLFYDYEKPQHNYKAKRFTAVPDQKNQNLTAKETHDSTYKR